LTIRSSDEIASYHAHIYFDPGAGQEAAETIRVGVAERFAVRLGRWWDGAIGPHSKGMYQIAFEPA
jgi:DOPA 4,5-dioxygenase